MSHIPDRAEKPRPRWLAWLFACFAALCMAGCAGLPTDVQRKPSVAIADGADTMLGRLVQAAAPPGEPLSGFRLLPMPQFSLHARIELARRAQRSIDVQYYLVQNDETGRYLLRALRDAADRGVRVRLLVDDLYTAGADPLFTSFASHPNVEVRLFNPFPAGRDRLGTRWAASLFDFDRVHRRMHNKLYVVDNTMAVMGGRNIANEYFLRDGGSNFIDIDTLVAGAVVPRLSSLFDMYWNSPYVYPIESLVPRGNESQEELRALFDRLTSGPETLHPEEPGSTDLLGNNPLARDLDAGTLKLTWARAEAYADPPAKALAPTPEGRGLPADQATDSVLYNVRRYLRGAQSEIMQTTPYLIPGRGGMESIRIIRGNGVSYSIVTNSLAATDESLVHIGYRRYRAQMLRLGVELYELSPKRVEETRRFGMYGSASGRLHGKSAVIDRKTVFIGSMNFDPRSELHNTEIGIFIFSPQIAQQLTSLIGFIRLDGAYQLQLGPRGGIEWVSPASGDAADTILHTEPETHFWSRWKLELMAPLVPESLL
ncbi:putative cardiolipin synthase [Variovorax boronicumulans]|uniref:phospholipase D family protein n=1 Tax=Variovorax boronicumulans TaxID=436515 RepID=UPI002474EC17|nr:phospholipase D family protein [Variovorax boronicumulans]MDH6165438.1 putative cardiolipin synthase [Variovorax boronicumulans]